MSSKLRSRSGPSAVLLLVVVPLPEGDGLPEEEGDGEAVSREIVEK